MQIKKIIQSIKPKAKSLLGIDINADSIRLVELSCLGSGYQVEACLNITPDTPITDDSAVAVLKKMLGQSQFKTKNAAAALTYSTIIFKEIKVEQGLADEELEDFLQFNIEKYVGESANDLSFDYQVVPTPPMKMNEYMTVRLITAKRERVEKCIRLLRALGFCPKVIDINSYALERAARRLLKDISGLVAIINIDRSAILIVVIDAEKMVCAREDFVDHKEMESVDRIIVQLQLKLQFVFSVLHQPLEQIILSGEKAMFTELGPAISNQFNIQTITLNPFGDMKLSASISEISMRKMAPAMSISCGLALRVTDGNWN